LVGESFAGESFAGESFARENFAGESFARENFAGESLSSEIKERVESFQPNPILKLSPNFKAERTTHDTCLKHSG